MNIERVPNSKFQIPCEDVTWNLKFGTWNYTPLKALKPPSTGMIAPVMKLAASEQRN